MAKKTAVLALVLTALVVCLWWRYTFLPSLTWDEMFFPDLLSNESVQKGLKIKDEHFEENKRHLEEQQRKTKPQDSF